MSELTRYTKADVVGPGLWYSLHLCAFAASKKRNNIDRSVVTSLVNHYHDHFPCGECRTHFQEMISDYPLSEVMTKDLFLKTFWFHRRVNDRLHKVTPLYEIVEKRHQNVFNDKDCANEFGTMARLGPGIWWLLHSLAHHSKDLFRDYVTLLEQLLHCRESREMLLNARLASGPNSEFPDNVYDFHSKVNTKLGKVDTDRDITLKFFKDSVTCQSGCTEMEGGLHNYNYVGI